MSKEWEEEEKSAQENWCLEQCSIEVIDSNLELLSFFKQIQDNEQPGDKFITLIYYKNQGLLANQQVGFYSGKYTSESFLLFVKPLREVIR